MPIWRSRHAERPFTSNAAHSVLCTWSDALPSYGILQVEVPKKALLLYGGRTSQVVKDVLSDFGKLKGVSGGERLIDTTTAAPS